MLAPQEAWLPVLSPGLEKITRGYPGPIIMIPLR